MSYVLHLLVSMKFSARGGYQLCRMLTLHEDMLIECPCMMTAWMLKWTCAKIAQFILDKQ